MAAVELENSTLRSDPNLQHYWRFEDTSAEVGSISLTNNGTVTFGTGKFNNGATFSDTNGQELTSTSFANFSGNYTFGFWLKLNTEITSSFYGIAEIDDDTNNVAARFLYNYNGGTPQMIATRTGSSDADATYNISLGTADFHLIVQTYDGTNLRLYIDGVLRATTATSGTGTTLANGTCFGDTPRFNNLNFPGVIDDAWVMDRAMSGSEITSRYDGTDAIGGSSASSSPSSSPSSSVSSSPSSSVSSSPSPSSSPSSSVSSSVSSSPSTSVSSSPSSSASSSPSPSSSVSSSPSTSVSSSVSDSPSSSVSSSPSSSPSPSSSVSSSPSSSASSSPSASSFTINNPTGTVSDGHEFVFRIKTASASTITWDTLYRGALPATTTGSNAVDYLVFKYNSTENYYDLVVKTMNIS